MKQKKRLIDQFVIALLVIGAYYYIYRYPLRINDANISASGYASTPLWLALGKYLLVILVLLYTALYKLITGRIKKHNALTDIAYAYLGIIPILYGLLQGQTIDIESGVFWIVALCLNFWFFNEKLLINGIAKFLNWTIHIAIVVEFAQISLYLLFGRLPALGFAGTSSIRFGSIMDDPNGFGLLLSLFFGFALFYYTKLQKLFIFVCLLLMLVATQSLTALASIIGAAFIYVLCYLYHKPNRFALNALLMIPVILLFMISIVFNFNLIVETISNFFTAKAGSIAQHTESLNQIFVLDLATLVGLTPHGHVGESGYVNYLANYGLFYLLAYLILASIAIYHYYFIIFRSNTNMQGKAIASGIFTYLLAVILANLNLPLREIFPHNLYVPLFLGLATSRIMRNSIM